MGKLRDSVLWTVVGILVTGGALPVNAHATGEPTGGMLDGQVFVGELGAQGQTAGTADEFSFHQGRFRSSACDEYGFGDAAYTAVLNEDTVNFESTTLSASNGTMQWTGRVTGVSVEGSAIWQKTPGGPVEPYWFKGTLKK